MGVRVIVDVPWTPASVETLVGLAAMIMLGTAVPCAVALIVPVELVMAPQKDEVVLVQEPVIVTENTVVVVTVAVIAQVVVAVPAAVRVTEAGLHVTVAPAGFEVKPVATDPANWKLVAPVLVRVTVTL